MEATIRSDVVPLYVSSPWSPQSPRALPELYQLLFGKEEATAIILIPLTIVQSLCRISWTVPIDILYLIAVHRRDSCIVPKSVVFNLVKPQNKNCSSIDVPHGVLAEQYIPEPFRQFWVDRQWSADRNAPDRTNLLRKTLTLDLTSLKIAHVNVNVVNGIFEVSEEEFAA
ncbi:MAG: hypothetical protein Q9208_002511 [Pyrenodesmia sp. 3 TL-2023]